jgi:undecaprenyl-diphosphatase
MEISFLYAIPHTAVLDRFFLSVTKIAGSYGQLWMIVAVVLLVFKKDQESRCRGASCLRQLYS